MKYTSLLLVGIAFILGIGIYILDKKSEGISLGSRFDSVRIVSNCTSSTVVIGATSTIISNSFSRFETRIYNSATNTVFIKHGLLAASGSGEPIYPSVVGTSTSSPRDFIIYNSSYTGSLTAYALSSGSLMNVTDCK